MISWFSLQNAKIFFEIDGKKQSIGGPLLFTHFGISGPLVFVLSAHAAHCSLSSSQPLSIKIQLYQDKDFDYWNNFLLESIKNSPNKLIRTILWQELPVKFINMLCTQNTKILDKKWSDLGKNDRKWLCHLLSGNLELNLVSRQAGDEFVTAGGVDTEQVSTKTMESLICSELFLGGEVLNVDGVTWWFNLQAAWCTGRIAALGILDK